MARGSKATADVTITMNGQTVTKHSESIPQEMKDKMLKMLQDSAAK
jgi:hypothetical protein